MSSVKMVLRASRGIQRLKAVLAVALGRVETAVIRLLGRHLSLTAGAACIAIGFADLAGPLPHDLYATVAQVLPVFLLVGVIEGRYFADLERREPFDRFVLRGWLLAALAGEAASVATLAGTGDRLILRGLMLLGCFASGLLLYAYATVGPARRLPRTVADAVDQVAEAAERGTGS